MNVVSQPITFRICRLKRLEIIIKTLQLEQSNQFKFKYFSVYMLRSSFSQSNIYSLSAKTHKNSLTISNCNELKMKSKRRLKSILRND